jgi:hypothetical protein
MTSQPSRLAPTLMVAAIILFIGTVSGAHLTLIAITSLTSQMLWWVLASSALALPGQAEPA